VTVPAQDTGRVVVLAGGLSHERDVSLRSGRRVAEALRAAGFDVSERDVDATLLAQLASKRPLCVVPMLHGEDGENGSLQEILSLADVAYVGSSSAACRLAFDKSVAKSVVGAAGLATPASVVLPAETFRELGASAVMDAIIQRLGLPVVVKPNRGGSALGMQVVRTPEELPSAMVGCFAYGPVALVEQLVEGVEVAVAVVEGADGPASLPAVEIRPDGGVYDYSARYTAGATEFLVPAALSAEAATACAEAAITAHTALGLRDLSRSDLIVDASGTVWFLEVNLAPGMTETSSVPLAVQAAGQSLTSVLRSLVQRAAGRASDPSLQR